MMPCNIVTNQAGALALGLKYLAQVPKKTKTNLSHKVSKKLQNFVYLIKIPYPQRTADVGGLLLPQKSCKFCIFYKNTLPTANR